MNYPSDEELAVWPNCSVPDCPNKSSRRLGSDKCHPHTLGLAMDREGNAIYGDYAPDVDDGSCSECGAAEEI